MNRMIRIYFQRCSVEDLGTASTCSLLNISWCLVAFQWKICLKSCSSSGWNWNIILIFFVKNSKMCKLDISQTVWNRISNIEAFCCYSYLHIINHEIWHSLRAPSGVIWCLEWTHGEEWQLRVHAELSRIPTENWVYEAKTEGDIARLNLEKRSGQRSGESLPRKIWNIWF